MTDPEREIVRIRTGLDIEGSGGQYVHEEYEMFAHTWPTPPTTDTVTRPFGAVDDARPWTAWRADGE